MTTGLADAPAARRASLAAIGERARAWRYEGGKRDLRFDFLRGFAVFAMVTDHIAGPRSFLFPLTGGDRFFISAAEAFVFLSGLLMGLVNGGMIRRGDVDGALAKVLRRAGMLYTLTVGLALITVALPVFLDWPDKADLGGLSLLEYVVGVFTLHRTAPLVDVMLLYTILVLVAEPVLLLLDRGYTRLILGLSWALWLIWQLWPQQALSLPADETALFQVSAWQLLFMNALVIGFHRRKLERAFRAIASPGALLVAGAALVGLIALYFADLAPLTRLAPDGDPAIVKEWLFSKRDVGAGRVVTFAALFVFLYALITLCWRPIVRVTGWLILPLGQNALSAYVIQIFVTIGFGSIRTALFGPAPNIVVGTLIQLAGLMLVWGIIKVRPILAATLDGYESAWSGGPLATTPEAAVLLDQATSIDVRIAQAEAHRGVDLLR